MSAGYQCLDCNAVFDAPELRRELDKMDNRHARHVVAELCPVCESEDIRSVILCSDCHDNGVDTLAVYDDFCEFCATQNYDPEQIEEFKRDQVQAIRSLVKGAA